jgi:PEP-CTERM motif
MKNLAKAATMAAVLAFAPVSAHAATVMITSTAFDAPGNRTGRLHVVSNNYTSGNVGIGRFALGGVDTATNNPVNYLTYCVDIFHYLGSAVFTMPSLASFISDPVKRADLLTFVTNANPLVNAAAAGTARQNASAAVQLGVWEILYETGTNYSVTAGNFYVDNGNSAAARTLVNGWLSNLASHSWTPVAGQRINLLYNARNQSQIFVGQVPEPATWAMLIAGFGFIGAGVRRARKAGARVFA